MGTFIFEVFVMPGLIATVGGIILCVILCNKTNREIDTQNRQIADLINSKEVKECMQTAAVMLGLLEYPNDHHSGWVMCSCQNVGINCIHFEALISDEDWVFYIRHYNDIYGNPAKAPVEKLPTLGNIFESDALHSALRWAKEYESALPEADSFEQVGINYRLDPERDKVLWFEKTILTPGDPWLYFLAVKEKAAKKYPKHFEFKEQYENLFHLK